MAIQHSDEVAGWFVMVFSGKRGGESIANAIFPHEEGRNSSVITADQSITFLITQQFERFQARAVIVGPIPDGDWIVRHHACSRPLKTGVVLDDDNPRPAAADGTPHPIVV